MTVLACAPVVLHDTIDSTNEEARRRFEAGCGRPVWIAARRQTSGRGRQGRPWQSQSGNLAATLLFDYPGGPAECARLSFAIALAVAETIDALAPGCDVALKWPNDVLLAGGKVSGILLESFGAQRNGTTPLAIGIGLNLASHPPMVDGAWRPTSVAAVTGSGPDVEAALATLTTATARWIDTTLMHGFAPVRAAWLARAARLGETIHVRLPHSEHTGRFADVDADGALVLEEPSGQRRIAAADVFFPEMP